MSYEKHQQKLLMQYPAIWDLQQKAKKRIPNVAWEYLQTGTGNEDLTRFNLEAFKNIRLTPQFCKGELKPNLQTQVLGQNFDAPFGIAPVGMSGLMWPKAEIILAKTAHKYQIPYTLSTVGTETPEAVSPHAGNMGWFQLYPPRKLELSKGLMDRAKAAGFHTMVVTADVPSPSRRERTKRAGLQMPPKITPHFVWQGIMHPQWSIATLQRGLPSLRTIESYSKFKTMLSVGTFTRDQLGGNLSWEYCQQLRDAWDGKMVLKGILHPKDAEKAVGIGMDGIVVSNHGGRQFDGAPTSMAVLPDIVRAVKGKTAILLDSGVRTGLDILRALSLGADFVMLGRGFMYGVAALGEYGGEHVVTILKDELTNNMVQLGVDSISDL